MARQQQPPRDGAAATTPPESSIARHAIGIDATGQRHETDSMGGTDVPADCYLGSANPALAPH
jgi:hypothetical protein